VEQLLEKEVVVAGMVTDNLFCQPWRLRFMTESATDPRIKGLITVINSEPYPPDRTLPP
jgi:hypothetical protein